jgi:5-(carboxyamino)imidazole ribonucleotide synthase
MSKEVSWPLPPGSTIGILGGGQLGRMLALAAARLGLDIAILTPDEDSPAGRVSKTVFVAPYDDADALAALAAASDVVTFEFENVPAKVVETLARLGQPVAPGAKALAVAQDRVDEKTFLYAAGVPTVAFEAVSSAEEAQAAVARMGVPTLLKTRRDGYDGKGQRWVRDPAQAAAAFAALDAPCILEAPAAFVRELSMVAARGRDGQVVTYPLAENHHEDGVLRRTLAPAVANEAVEAQAIAIAGRILEGLDYVGVLAVELFELADGALLVNEIAPRVHNTGHWTKDGCVTDQFEQHIRAVAGWPLGPTTPLARVEMTNLLGHEVDAWRELAAEDGALIHLYGKRRAAPGRKMGHVNRLKPL